MAGGFNWQTNTLGSNLASADARVQRYIAGVMNYHASQMQAKAKRRARWTDRTGNARSGLGAIATAGHGGYAIILFHQVPYGIWLELAHNGRFAIIAETIQNEEPLIMRTLSQLMAAIANGSGAPTP